MAVTYNLTIRADRDYFLPVTVVTQQGNPANMTNYLVTMTVKNSVNDADNVALFKSSTPYAVNLPFGTFTFKIPRSVTNVWWVAPSGPISTTMVYDVSCQDIATVQNWSTLLEGSVTVIGPVTRTIP